MKSEASCVLGFWLGSTVTAALSAGYCGVALWQFADARVDAAWFEEERPEKEEEEQWRGVRVGGGVGEEGWKSVFFFGW